MRASVLGSSIIHLMVLAALFAVRNVVPTVVPGPDVVQVSLVEPSEFQTWTPPASAKQPEVKAAEIKPTEETGVKVAPPKVTKPKPEPERKEPPAPSTIVPALPSAPAGSAGLRGDISIDAGDFEFTYYLLLVRNRIAQNWSPPAGLLSSGGAPVRAVVTFRVARGGEVSGVRVETGSGVEYFDRSALRAVLISDPLPPLPLGYTGSDLGIHFGFEYAVP